MRNKGDSAVFFSSHSSKQKKVLLFLLAVFSSGGCSCSREPASSSETSSHKIRVTLEESPYFSAEQTSEEKEKGSDFSFDLTFPADLAYESCSFKGALFASSEKGKGKLTLPKVLYPTRVQVSVISSQATISYFLNGGTFIDPSLSGTNYLVSYDLSHHLRANTSDGISTIRRDGYVLSGWNAEEDGSGLHIGLGSRVSLAKNELLNLYAEWQKALDPSLFDCEEKDGLLKLTAFKGPADTESLVIPETINGKPVAEIGTGFAFELLAKKAYFPPTLFAVDIKAFVSCRFEEIYTYDRLGIISDLSFYRCPIKTWHLNAAEAPRYQKISDNIYFADDIDRLILLQQQKKMIFFGGCSMSYGLKSELAEEAFGQDYAICDIGVIGGTNAKFQLDIIGNYLKSDDVLIHAPEEASPYQLMYDLSAECRMYQIIEGNFDLLSLVNLSEFHSAFSAFELFNKERLQMEPGSYSDYRNTYNQYGDIVIPRPSVGADQTFSHGVYSYSLQYSSSEAIGNLISAYQKLTGKGAKVLFSFAPLNLSNLTDEDRNSKIYETFQGRYASALSLKNIPVISKAEDYLLKGRYFYDTDFHLNDEGAAIRTNRLISDIQKQLA